MATKKIIEVDVVNSLSDNDAIFVNSSNSLKQISKSNLVTNGEDGGYYIPSVDDDGNLTWTTSKTDMPAIDGANIKGPQGVSGVYVGSGDMPEGYNVQIDPDGRPEELPTTLPNPNALTFTGAVTGSYDGSAPLKVNIPSGGSGGPAEPGYKDATTLFDVTLDDTTGGLKSYEYDVSGIEKTDVIIINILFPESYTGQISIKNQADVMLTAEFLNKVKGMAIGLKVMNGRYMHSCVSNANISARLDMPLSLFYGQLNGSSGFERPKAPDTITKLKFTLSAAFVSGTQIRAYRW